jgi:hypothetical protein
MSCAKWNTRRGQLRGRMESPWQIH